MSKKGQSIERADKLLNEQAIKKADKLLEDLNIVLSKLREKKRLLAIKKAAKIIDDLERELGN